MTSSPSDLLQWKTCAGVKKKKIAVTLNRATLSHLSSRRLHFCPAGPSLALGHLFLSLTSVSLSSACKGGERGGFGGEEEGESWRRSAREQHPVSSETGQEDEDRGLSRDHAGRQPVPMRGGGKCVDT